MVSGRLLAHAHVDRAANGRSAPGNCCWCPSTRTAADQRHGNVQVARTSRAHRAHEPASFEWKIAARRVMPPSTPSSTTMSAPPIPYWGRALGALSIFTTSAGRARGGLVLLEAGEHAGMGRTRGGQRRPVARIGRIQHAGLACGRGWLRLVLRPDDVGGIQPACHANGHYRRGDDRRDPISRGHSSRSAAMRSSSGGCVLNSRPSPREPAFVSLRGRRAPLSKGAP